MILKIFTRIFMALLLSGVMSQVWAQGGSVGLHTTVAEYDGDLSGNRHHFYGFDQAKFGAGLSFSQYLNPSFNLVEMATYNRLQYQNVPKTEGVTADFTTLNANLRYKFNNGYIFKENAAIAPFLTAGLGATYLNSKVSTGNPENTDRISNGVIKGNLNAGAGILFQFNDRVGLEFANTIQMPLYDAWDGVSKGQNDVYLQHSLGLIFNLKKPLDTDGDGVQDRKDKCPDTPKGVTVDSKGCPMDADKDGVPDYLDNCPTVPGFVGMNGCPDRDNDGVADQLDKCPDVPGPARFDGCPDTDGDGIQDSEDNCPNVKGLDTFKGCPDTDGDGVEDSQDKCQDTPKGVKVDAAGCTADTDGDGVIDTEDACPNIAGAAENKGCPEIKPEVKQLFQKALQGIQFESGRAVIKAVSFPIMDAITKVMQENPTYKMYIGGHTDDIGDDAMNMTLSQNRADAVANYLIAKGVDPLRISAKGFGESVPVDTNKSSAGRARNRRVEFRVEFLQ
jgi:OmpA-OmpF porin, OOP family